MHDIQNQQVQNNERCQQQRNRLYMRSYIRYGLSATDI